MKIKIQLIDSDSDRVFAEKVYNKEEFAKVISDDVMGLDSNGIKARVEMD